MNQRGRTLGICANCIFFTTLPLTMIDRWKVRSSGVHGSFTSLAICCLDERQKRFPSIDS
uniref:Uncharacterized protein n=1 Tax=Onchocerca volvulus TaxID=6282 RepID=A0A8R1XUW7_ONCVO